MKRPTLGRRRSKFKVTLGSNYTKIYFSEIFQELYEGFTVNADCVTITGIQKVKGHTKSKVD